MPELLLHNKPVKSVFSLLGEKENDITFSLGWALAQSPSLLQRFVKTLLLGQSSVSFMECVIGLQEFQRDSGITDLEIRGANLHLIIEAKRGWTLPADEQLQKYLRRFRETRAKNQVIVTASECSQSYAREYLPKGIRGIPIRHISWSEVGTLSRFPDGTHAEKRLMQEFRNYIATIVNMQPKESNWVYVVSLNYDEWAPGLTFVDVVEKRRLYFHPYGRGGWPLDPPNYMGFRYGGRLRSICHVESAEVIRNFHKHIPERPSRDDGPHFLYHLGPSIQPAKEVKTGKIFRSGRKWAMLDLLLTSETIADATAKSFERVRET